MSGNQGSAVFMMVRNEHLCIQGIRQARSGIMYLNKYTSVPQFYKVIQALFDVSSDFQNQPLAPISEQQMKRKYFLQI